MKFVVQSLLVMLLTSCTLLGLEIDKHLCKDKDEKFCDTENAELGLLADMDIAAQIVKSLLAEEEREQEYYAPGIPVCKINETSVCSISQDLCWCRVIEDTQIE